MIGIGSLFPPWNLCVQVVGMESFPIKNGIDHYDILVRHIIHVRKIPGLEHALVVLATESNLGNEAMHHEFAIKRSGLVNVCIINEDTDNKAGIRLDNTLKRTMAMQFNIALLGDMVYFHHKLVTLNTKAASPSEAVDRIIENAIHQMLSYNKIIRPAKDIFAKPKEIYTGKSGGGKDDLIISLQINYWAWMCFMNHTEKYSEYHKKYSISAK